MIRIGMKALSSAEISLGERTTLLREMAGAIAVAVVLVAGLFVALPMLVSEYLTSHFGLSHITKTSPRAYWGPDFYRLRRDDRTLEGHKQVFAYHGAEHKAINAYENGSNSLPRT